MNILIINGSPKGKTSITLQTLNYLSLLHPEHSFDVLHVGQLVKTYEKDMTSALDAIKKAELLIFSYPVYTFIAPSQLHRFIELMKASGADFSDKYATQISTSKHFYDITAHAYIADNCKDMKMKYIKGLSADMDDLTTEKGQKEAREFFDRILYSMKEGIFEKLPAERPPFVPVLATVPDSVPATVGDIAIITDCEEDNPVLRSMIDRFSAVVGRKTRVINLREFPFKGGCLGCFNCAVSGKCIYKDGFDDFLRGTIQTAEAIVYAFTVKDHSMGALFKLYDDRQFCNGHRTVTMGMPFAYLISGDYENEFNLRMIVEGRAEVGGNYLAGVATNAADTDAEIDKMAKNLVYALENKIVTPQNFYGIGGMKIFRDLIWIMQGMMRADHKFYKSHGQYDFPQKQRGRMLAMYLVGALLSSESLKKKAGGKMTEGMLMPYNKVLEKTRKQLDKGDKPK